MRKATLYSWRNHVLRYVVIALGSFICGVSINAFLVPHHMLSGGLAGIAMIFHFLFNWPIGIMVALMNLPIMYAAYRLMDKAYFASAMYGMLIFSVAIDATRGLADLNVVDDIMLAAIYGGVISGIGSGLVFRVNASSGGTDTIAALLKKYYAFNVSFVGFSINCVLMTIAAFLFGFKPAMYTLLSMYVGANVIDRVIQGFNTKKTVTIISDKAEEIAGEIMNEVGRGVTFLRGEGGFTHDEKKVLFVVVTLMQMAKIKPIVTAVDPFAFMIVQDAVEVLGHGFTLPHTKKSAVGE
jgi:uncharacterized membrane-anchored protein YitT (DUF2179 family)